MNSELQFPIKKSWIMSILLIVPAVALFAAWDWFLNDKQLLPHLGFNSLFLPLYLLVFELPHVIAGFFGFFTKEYSSHYRKHLVVGLPLTLLAFVILAGFNFYMAIVVYLCVTLFHVIRQQTGIALFFGVPKNIGHACWSWSLIIGLASMYIILQPNFVSDENQGMLMFFVNTALLISACLSLHLLMQTKSLLGFVYILATLSMAAVSYTMLMLGYDFLSVLVVRVIHDVTAFIFYITHEMNFNRQTVKNLLYKYIPFLPWSLVLFVPLSAIVFGLTIRSLIVDPRILLAVVMTFSFAHYYLESIIWKRDGLHRKHIFLS